jgi:aminopeptidase N
MVVVQGDFPDGMEFSGLVFVSSDWFHRYEGTPTDYLTVITVHEVAHQWWYARVGNDAAMCPWMDEALATYSEYIFIEEYYPDLKDWWWQWRVERYSPIGNVDSSVYDFVTIREYINAVYLRGAKMLHQLRQDIGTQAFFDLLRNYAASETGRIATRTLLGAPDAGAVTEDTGHAPSLSPATADGGTAS